MANKRESDGVSFKIGADFDIKNDAEKDSKSSRKKDVGNENEGSRKKDVGKGGESGREERNREDTLESVRKSLASDDAVRAPNTNSDTVISSRTKNGEEEDTAIDPHTKGNTAIIPHIKGDTVRTSHIKCDTVVDSRVKDGNEEDTGSGTEENGKTETSPERPDGSVGTKRNGFSLRTITVVGQIEGHTELPQSQKSTKYELLIPQLVEIEENEEVDALLLILNTVGGDVEAGLALSELISGMKKPTASLVLGGGHSIGVPLAVCTDRSFIVPTATMTLHPVRTTGLVLSAPQSFVQLSRMQERIISFVSGHSRISPERLRTLMLSSDEMTTDLGTILDGKAAVSEGLIDGIGSLSDATDYLRHMVSERKR